MENFKVPINGSFSFEKKLKSLEDLQPVPVTNYRLLYGPQDNDFVLISTPLKQFIQPISSADANYIAFYTEELHHYSHIPTIYQLHLDFMRECGNSIVSITIETVQGDILYGKIIWKTKRNKIFTNQCGLGDSIIFSILSNVKLNIISSALDKIEEYDSSNSNYEFLGDDDDDYEEYEDDDE
jgi:bifunctional DNase/RNase